MKKSIFKKIHLFFLFSSTLLIFSTFGISINKVIDSKKTSNFNSSHLNCFPEKEICGNENGTNWSGYISGKIICSKETDIFGNKYAIVHKVKEIFSDEDIINFIFNPSFKRNSFPYSAHNLIIPDSIIFSDGEKLPLRIIDEKAFAFCDISGKLTIGKNIEIIAKCAFYGNNQIDSELILSDKIIFVGEYAFMYCVKISHLSLGKNIKYIGAYAFSNCSNISGELKLPTFLNEINEYTFANTSIDKIIFNKKIKKIGAGAFDECGSLRGELIIPDSVEEIDADAFYLTNFTSLKLGKNIKKIGMCAFEGLDLKEVIIPKSMTSIGECAFAKCKLINIINYSPYFKFASEKSVGKAKVLLSSSHISDDIDYETDDSLSFIDREGKKWGGHEIVGCLAIGKVNIPENVRKIGIEKFSNCAGITSINFSKSIEEIKSSAFNYCSGLAEINIPNRVENIEDYSFANLEKVDKLIIGKNVKNIDKSAFKDSKINNIINHSPYFKFASEKSVGKAKILLSSSHLSNDFDYEKDSPIASLACGEIAIPYDVKRIGDFAFYDCVNLKGKLTLPQNLKYIGLYSFSFCSFEGNLNIPDSVEFIGEGAFQNTKFEGFLHISESISYLPNCVFSDCNFHGKLILPEKIDSIGNFCFANCEGFTGDLIIPKNITEIGINAFFNNSLNGNVYLYWNNIEILCSNLFACKRNKISQIKNIVFLVKEFPILNNDEDEEKIFYEDWNLRYLICSSNTNPSCFSALEVRKLKSEYINIIFQYV